MESVDRRLVRRDARLILLLDPPFDKSDLNPGYIKGYVPGVRENGGQYTHSAIWTVMASGRDGGQRARVGAVLADQSHFARRDTGRDRHLPRRAVRGGRRRLWRRPHTGRGGWTWYTGSAGWMYRLIVESLLGLQLEVDKLRITPCLPAAWTRSRSTIAIARPSITSRIHNSGAGATVRRLSLDGSELSDDFVTLVDDRREHKVEVEM